MTDPSLVRDRTALAWTRSALNMAASGTLIARGAFASHLETLGVACAVATAVLTVLMLRYGRTVYDPVLMGASPPRRAGALGLLTAVTVVTAAVALVVTIAI
jgi:hypothetical protein